MSRAEKFIEENTRNCSNTIQCYGGDCDPQVIYKPWLTPNQALKAVKIARKEELEYVEYQLDLRLPETLDYNGVQVDREDFINEFIKAMKDE